MGEGLAGLSDEAVLPLADGFPAAGEERWRALVERVLKGAPFERLIGHTADGIAIQPLYHPGNAPTLPEAWPGLPPFTRGVRPAGCAVGGWDVRQHEAHPDPSEANRAILEALENGATSLRLILDDALAQARERPNGIRAHTPEALAALLDGVLLDLAPLALEAGACGLEAAERLIELIARRGHEPGAVRAELGIDPLGAAVRGAAIDPVTMLADAAALARGLAQDWPALRALAVDGRPYHAAGATDGQELAVILATAVEYLRALERAGLAPDAALPRLSVIVAVDCELFGAIAKLRALRRLWGELCAACDAAAAARHLTIEAVTAERMFAQRDPWVNLLRGTIACAAAALGGADAVTVLPFDHALGPPDAFSRRLARNTQLVLLEESHLSAVADPAGGSWYVESLTDALAERGWTLLQEIERDGGMLAALRAGTVQARITAAWGERAQALATRREAITGVSEFPNLAERPRRAAAPASVPAEVLPRPQPPRHAAASTIAALPARRLAAGFERLRDRSDLALARDGARPRLFLARLGTVGAFGARAIWARNLLEAGGIEVIESAPVSDPAALVAVWRAAGALPPALVSSDEIYAVLAEPAIRALRAAAAPPALIIGRPAAQAEALLAAGAAGFVSAGMDLLRWLDELHDRLGTPRPAEEAGP
jgi:methylmalonyl-CoA mutase